MSPDLPTVDARALLAGVAESAGDRLRRGEVARGDRAALRTRLSEAFALVQADAAPELARAAHLARRIDTLASPAPPFRLTPPRIGVRFARGAVDPALVERISAYGALAERVSDRIDAFLEATGSEPLRLFVREVVAGTQDSPEMTFTEG